MSDEKFAANVTRSADNVAEARRRIEAASINDHLLEAASNAEEIIKMLQQDWADRGFSPEQCVFSLALVTINFREGVPEKFGGKEMFDRVAREAKAYYNTNK